MGFGPVGCPIGSGNASDNAGDSSSVQEEGRACFPLLMSSLASKEDGNQIPGMEIESLVSE